MIDILQPPLYFVPSFVGSKKVGDRGIGTFVGYSRIITFIKSKCIDKMLFDLFLQIHFHISNFVVCCHSMLQQKLKCTNIIII